MTEYCDNCKQPLKDIAMMGGRKTLCINCAKKQIAKGLRMIGAEIRLCENCMQVTNHKEGVCLKCGRKKVNPDMLKYEKYRCGTVLEIIEDFGNNRAQKVIGYYWMNDATNRRIILMSSLPPLKLSSRYLEKRFCNYDTIKEIKILVYGGKNER